VLIFSAACSHVGEKRSNHAVIWHNVLESFDDWIILHLRPITITYNSSVALGKALLEPTPYDGRPARGYEFKRFKTFKPFKPCQSIIAQFSESFSNALNCLNSWNRLNNHFPPH